MKAIQITKFGVQNLSIKDIEKPKINEDEILVKVHSFSLNYMDILLIEGNYNPNLKLPHIPGSDASGTVVEVGSNIKDFRVEDEVMTHYFIDWQSGSFKGKYFNHRYGSEGRGVFAEYIAVSENGLIKKPKSLTLQESSTLPITGLTAWNSIIEENRLYPGQNILIIGTGGVSIFALQIAKLIGLNVCVITSSDELSAKVKRLGAQNAINYKKIPDWEKHIYEVFPDGADIVIDVVGDLDKAIKALAVNGTIKVVGFLGTSESKIGIFDALMSQAKILASTPGSKESFSNLVKAIDINGLKPIISSEFTFDDIKEAFNYMKNGDLLGKVVVSVS